MKKSKKLARLLLVIVALVGVGFTAQTSRANCLLPVTFDNGDQGFISCGSSAGTYLARNTGSGWETYDGGGGEEFLCFLNC